MQSHFIGDSTEEIRMLEDVNAEEEGRLCCILADLVHAHIHRAPG